MQDGPGTVVVSPDCSLMLIDCGCRGVPADQITVLHAMGRYRGSIISWVDFHVASVTDGMQAGCATHGDT